MLGNPPNLGRMGETPMSLAGHNATDPESAGRDGPTIVDSQIQRRVPSVPAPGNMESRRMPRDNTSF